MLPSTAYLFGLLLLPLIACGATGLSGTRLERYSMDATVVKGRAREQ